MAAFTSRVRYFISDKIGMRSVLGLRTVIPNLEGPMKAKFPAILTALAITSAFGCLLPVLLTSSFL
jgi:hypothetical protein